MTYTAILEHGASSWGAYIPDLPGCNAAGSSREEVDLLRERGESVPEPSITIDVPVS